MPVLAHVRFALWWVVLLVFMLVGLFILRLVGKAGWVAVLPVSKVLKASSATYVSILRREKLGVPGLMMP